MAIICDMDEIGKIYPEIVDMLRRNKIDLTQQHEIRILATTQNKLRKFFDSKRHIILYVNDDVFCDDVFCDWIEARYDQGEEVSSVEIILVAGEIFRVVVTKYIL